ncbi:DUF3307 domain-containing protein [Sphaerisporangium sp. NPDC051017]|uniref:DUF3307 domain-containing protein n=1 Tax=Sphaerisporangium sp. NPDC051017 TaxID=3154636 RepID=UPI00344A2964
MSAATFAAVFAALYAAHTFGDHWVQTHHQACGKAASGWPGRLACARHVATLTATKLLAVAALLVFTDLTVHPAALAVGVVVDAASHYAADRRRPLAWLAEVIGKGEFFRFGAPRPGTGDAPHLGTGAYALDQSWHVAWLFIAALIIAAG